LQNKSLDALSLALAFNLLSFVLARKVVHNDIGTFLCELEANDSAKTSGYEGISCQHLVPK
jgi:hypothetical protein